MFKCYWLIIVPIYRGIYALCQVLNSVINPTDTYDYYQCR